MPPELSASAPRLFLITPPVADAALFAPLLEAAVAAVDVACVLLRTRARDEGEAKSIIRVLAKIAQAGDAAALVEDARLAARVDADGVHVSGSGQTLDEALAALKPRRIVGCGDLAGRDAAMAAGEAGVDYLMFGGPGRGDHDTSDHDAILEQVAWWATIFNVPCVGYAGAPSLAGEIARAGAEFVALCDGLWDAPDEIAMRLREVTLALHSVRVST